MDCHRPLAFAMIVWVGCGDYHNEIATGFSSPRNDRFGLCVVVAILRLPRLFQSLAMTGVVSVVMTNVGVVLAMTSDVVRVFAMTGGCGCYNGGWRVIVMISGCMWLS